MEVAFFGPCHPLFEWGSLNSVNWPVPSILTLNNVELSVESMGHDSMTGVRSSSIHDQWVKTIESHDSEVVSRFDLRVINLNFLSISFLEVVVSGPPQEFNIGVLHIFWNLWLEEWNGALCSKSSNEGLESGIN